MNPEEVDNLPGGFDDTLAKSFLFVDICDHSNIVRDLDPEENLAGIDPALKRRVRIGDPDGGPVARFQEDGFTAVFGLPFA